MSTFIACTDWALSYYYVHGVGYLSTNFRGSGIQSFSGRIVLDWMFPTPTEAAHWSQIFEPGFRCTWTRMPVWYDAAQLWQPTFPVEWYKSPPPIVYNLRVRHWFLVVITTLGAVATSRPLISQWRDRNRARRALCMKCGYDLRASEGRCPECGEPIPAGTPTK